jgi:DNA-binding response OmpR family regulator
MEKNANPKRILLIDDDPDLRLALRLPLESAGYAISEADSLSAGKIAVREVSPDLIILDVMMDTTTAGFQFALELHSADPQSELSKYRNIPIIMLTAIHTTTPLRFAPDEDYLPVQTFLEKPVEPDVLLAKVRELMGE